MSDNVMALSRESDARRREIEVRIEAHRDAAAGNLLEVGRWLNAAKDEGLVPHGEWTAWVAEHAALGERTAQLWMQAARELPEGSSLAALGTAKLRSLMSLPAGERETFAEQIGADKLTSREVDAQVKAARAERDEALRLVGEQKKCMEQLKADFEESVNSAAMTARNNAELRMQREMDEAVRKARAEAEKDAEDKLRQGTNKIWERAKASYAERLAAARSRIDALEAHIVDARAEGKADAENALADKMAAQKREYARLEEQAMAQARELADVKSQLLDAKRKKTDEEALVRMTAWKDEAEKKCAEAEREIDRLSEALDEAQTAAMRGGMAGEGERTNPATMILSAIGALMAQAGRAPAELMRMQGLDEETRQLMAGQARLVGQWAMQILAACGEGDAHA